MEVDDDGRIIEEKVDEKEEGKMLNEDIDKVKQKMK